MREISSGLKIVTFDSTFGFQVLHQFKTKFSSPFSIRFYVLVIYVLLVLILVFVLFDLYV